MKGDMIHMVFLLLLPLVGGLVAFASGKTKAPLVALLGMIPGFLLSLLMLNSAFADVIVYRWEWVPGYELGWRIDEASALLIALVYFISLLD